jgi:transglutaminase-like putative cysteine protease
VTADPSPTVGIRRVVSTHLETEVSGGTDLVMAIAVAGGYAREEESLRVRVDGTEVASEEIDADHGGRLHLVRDVAPGTLVIDYEATVSGPPPSAPEVSDLDRVRYLRPSRYCESDRLGPLARDEFAGLDGHQLLEGVSSWVGTNIRYVTGSSRHTDGAVETLMAREGVCRDFAHLTAALLRANGVPTRVASVYAPGLEPMDFHAVAEALVDGRWIVVDPTLLAPRRSMVRIATGADASDTAFLATLRGALELRDLSVTAVADPALPGDDVTDVVQLR